MSSGARIVDRGYRHYDGPRKASSVPILSLAKHSAQRALGIRRSAATKILPILSMTFAYLPAAALVGAVALAPAALRRSLPDYQQYYGLITAAIFLFTALASPELLCPDRRTGMLGLYLTSPLTPRTYLAAKAIAMVAILSIVTLGPPLLLTIAYALQGVGPDNAGDLVITLLRIIAAGMALAGSYGAAALAISSLTDRRAFASAGIVLAILVPGIILGTLVGAFDYPRWVLLLSLNGLPFELVQRIYGQRGNFPEADTPAVVAGWIGLVGVCAGVLLARYPGHKRAPKATP